jgi:hypothetical protein
MSELLSFSNAMNKKKNKKAWNAFFAHMASAQNAAADECRSLALDLESEGRFDLADHYRVFESEEREHAASIRSLCTDWIELNRNTNKLYRDKLVGKTNDNFEKMAILHFSLDTSFLTILASIHRNADVLFNDPAWAERVRARLAPIVRDEVFHLNEGQEMTIEIARTRPVEVKQKLKKRLNSHQRMVARAFSRLLSGGNVPETWVNEMNENYRKRFERSIHALN